MKSPFLILILALVLLLSMSCSMLSGPAATAAPTPSGDTIATAVAGTLAAASAKTATSAAKIQQTALAATPSSTPTTPVTPALTATQTETQAPTQAAMPPIPSVSGVTVAYVGEGNDVWIWRDGQTRALTHLGDVSEVAISDDKRWIAFTRTMNYIDHSLWSINVDGQNERALMSSETFASLPRAPGTVAITTVMFNWVPGTHTVAFSTRPIFETPGLLLNDDLWLVNADSLERKEMLPAGKGGKFFFSRDGKQIALVKSTSISLINADGSNRRDAVLTFPQVSTYSEYLFYPTPVWLPDGSGLRVAIPPEASLEHPEASTDIWEIPVNGSTARKIGSVNTVPLKFPELSPDGSKLAYFKQVGAAAENRSELHITNADGTEDQQYSADPLLNFVSWSPDAGHFFFTTGTSGQPWIGAVGASPQPVSGATGAMEARWLDNTNYLFVTHNNGIIELRQGNLTGSNQILASLPGQDGSPLLYDFAH